jgi:hypothetical protein
VQTAVLAEGFGLLMAGMLRSGNIACGLRVAISMGIGGQDRHADFPSSICLFAE